MSDRFLRYARWLDRRRWLILAASVVVAAGSVLLASRLQIRSEFSHLLPPTRKSVEDLEALKQRVKAFGTVFVVIEGESPEATRRAGEALAARMARLDPSVAAHVTADDAAARQFFWQHRFLFADLADLTRAHDALEERIRAAKVKAHPGIIDFDEGDDEIDEAKTKADIEALRKKLDEAEAKAKATDHFVSDDGLVKLFIVRSTQPSTNLEETRALVEALQHEATAVEAEVPGAHVGLTGDVTSTYLEHKAITRGVAMTALITLILIGAGLLLYYRSGWAVASALWALAVGALLTFAFTWLLIGHLNIMSAFLVGIVAGNGINSGLILLSRYFEELRAGGDHDQVLARALRGARGGTLAAAIAAGVAYGALMVTEFRGFRHFGVIGSTGMLLCWLSTYSVMPAALCALHRLGRIKPSREPAIGRLLGWLAPVHPRRIVLTAFALTALAVIGTGWFVADDPLENDWRKLRSDSADIREAMRLDEVMREKLDKKFGAGITSRFVVATTSRAQVAAVAATLRKDPNLISGVTTVDDLLPRDQDKKVPLVNAIVKRLNEPGLMDELDKEDRALVERVRPPGEVRALDDADLPEELVWPFVEKGGERGRLILVAGNERFQTWNVAHRLELADGVRGLGLPADVVVGGQAFVIADIIRAMKSDGPVAALVAVLGAMLAVWLLVGARRHGAITLGAGAAGVFWMVAVCAAIGMKVNFLDLIALPITIGIGLDYAVNLTARHRDEPGTTPKQLLASTGGAVVMCSYTTVVGYGALLFSGNAGIRSFGLAAIIGEATCLAAALLLVPSLLAASTRPAK